MTVGESVVVRQDQCGGKFKKLEFYADAIPQSGASVEPAATLENFLFLKIPPTNSRAVSVPKTMA